MVNLVPPEVAALAVVWVKCADCEAGCLDAGFPTGIVVSIIKVGRI